MRQGVKRKATSPIPGPKTAKIPDETLSEIGQNLLFKPEVHIDRLSPTNLELTKESPVKVITENPLVIQPAMVCLHLLTFTTFYLYVKKKWSNRSINFIIIIPKTEIFFLLNCGVEKISPVKVITENRFFIIPETVCINCIPYNR